MRKLKSNSQKGIFLGYIPNTTMNILWYDPETNKVKIAKHTRFDEGMNNLLAILILPNVVHLNRLQPSELIPVEDGMIFPQFECHIDPFPKILSKKIQR